MANINKTAKKKAAASLRGKANGKLVFAFDFGEYSVKIALLKIKKGAPEVRYLFTAENKDGLTKLDSSNIKNWRACIQKELSKRYIATDNRYAICSFGAKNFIHRVIEIPFTEDSDREGLVENEMSQLLALDSSAYIFQHELLEVNETMEESEDGMDEIKKTCKVWAVAMSKETCSAAYELLKSLKLKPLICDIHVNGMKRFLMGEEFLQSNLDQTVACIDYGMTNTEIMFIKEDKILGDSLIDIGDGKLVNSAKLALGSNITDATNQNKIIISPEEICSIMNKTHMTPEEQIFAANVEEWLSKVNTAITRFNYEHVGDQVEKIYIYGGSPQIGWLDQYLYAMTKIPTLQFENSYAFDSSNLMGGGDIDFSTYLNVLTLALMD